MVKKLILKLLTSLIARKKQNIVRLRWQKAELQQMVDRHNANDSAQ